MSIEFYEAYKSSINKQLSESQNKFIAQLKKLEELNTKPKTLSLLLDLVEFERLEYLKGCLPGYNEGNMAFEQCKIDVKHLIKAYGGDYILTQKELKDNLKKVQLLKFPKVYMKELKN